MKNFAKLVLDNGGKIKPLFVSSEETNGTGLCNPSVFVEGDTRIFVNLRHLNYSLYHSELNNYEHQFGPLVYLHPENDPTLTTNNIVCELDEDFEILWSSSVDTSKFDKSPLWEFIGLEDSRIFRWEDKVYLCGCRRDVDTIGTSRMELSEIDVVDGKVKEVNRIRIPGPEPDNEYCNKNWMPILDKPYHFIKWSNPTQVVKYNPETHTTETVHLESEPKLNYDQRGSSQVIPYEDGYLALTHETYLYQSEAGRKDATYRHRFIFWDKDFNVKKKSKIFTFLNTKIEFSCGMAKYKDTYLITFGIQDNCSYILQVPENIVEEMINAD